MILIKSVRYEFAASHTLAKFFINDVPFGFILEDAVRDQKIAGQTAIPAGSYKLSLYSAPKHSREYYVDENGKLYRSNVQQNQILATQNRWKFHDCLLLNDVPNFDGILIHWGNTADDTAGCQIVGGAVGMIGDKKAVLTSRKKYEEIYPIVWKALNERECEMEITSA